jgi:hypothetical protein
MDAYPQYAGSNAYLTYMEIKQRNTVVCSNTLYRYDAWHSISTSTSSGSCQLTLKVNGVAITTSDALSYTAGGASTAWSQVSGYYLAAPGETSVTLQLRKTCAVSGGASTQLQTYLDDVTFTPVTPP